MRYPHAGYYEGAEETAIQSLQTIVNRLKDNPEETLEEFRKWFEIKYPHTAARVKIGEGL